MRLALVSAALLISLAACKRDEGPPSTAAIELIPADIQGIYGRTAEDAPGMVVSASGFEFGQMTLTIHEGKMEGDTVRVERATLAWAKLEPKTCTGTIARQGDRLLLSLYDSKNTEAKCESVLDAAWHRWEQLDGLPELLLGRYGALLIEPDGMRLDVDWLHAELKTTLIRELPGSNDERAEVLIADAQVTTAEPGEDPQTFTCSGTMILEEARLTTDFWVPLALVPEPGTPEAEDPARRAQHAANEDACDRWDGSATKYEVSLAQLPKQPIAFGPLKLDISQTQVVLDSPALRCEQELWRTESVETRPGWPGGERMTLGRAAPKHVSDDCKLKLRIWCEVQDGTEVAAIDPSAEPAEHVAACIDLTAHELCPHSITLRAISDTRYKVHIEPPSFNQIACVDPTGEFSI